jgi:murein DD-endopeptidase MepM/ murein hydrolase activator NlpD
VATAGSPIRASAPGLVAYSDNRVRGYGNLLLLVHGDGSVTLHAHCQRVLVFAGQRVEQGQVIAEVGMTGLAMGPHLHFEYHRAGEAVDPTPLFSRDSGGPSNRARTW